MEFKISLAQMEITFGDPAANFTTVTRMTEEARRRGSELILFPELWSTAYDLTHASRYASSLTLRLRSPFGDFAGQASGLVAISEPLPSRAGSRVEKYR